MSIHINNLISHLNKSFIFVKNAVYNLSDLETEFIHGIIEGNISDEMLLALNNKKIREDIIETCILFCFITTNKCLLTLLHSLYEPGKCMSLINICSARKLEDTPGSNDNAVNIIFEFEQFTTKIINDKWKFHTILKPLFIEEIKTMIQVVEKEKESIDPHVVNRLFITCAEIDDIGYMELLLSSKIIIDMIDKNGYTMEEILRCPQRYSPAVVSFILVRFGFN